MKTGNALIAVTAVLMLAACSQSGDTPPAQASGEAVTLAIKGMNCAAWPDAVKAALDRVAGVQIVEIDFKNRTAQVVYDPEMTGPEMLLKAVAYNNVFEASVLPSQHPTDEDGKEPGSRDEGVLQENERKEQQ